MDPAVEHHQEGVDGREDRIGEEALDLVVVVDVEHAGRPDRIGGDEVVQQDIAIADRGDLATVVAELGSPALILELDVEQGRQQGGSRGRI